jgi:hypothetical protein
VTINSKAVADRLFPNADAAEALGKRLTFGADEKTQQTLTIVGVTGDFPTAQMSTEREQLLLPLEQHPSPKVFLGLRRRRRDRSTRRSPRQPRPCTPRRVGPADGGHAIGIGFLKPDASRKSSIFLQRKAE